MKTTTKPPRAVRVGCAGWAVPKASADAFPAAGTHLSRYAGRLPAVEVNSSFYRPHKPSTYAKWAASVPGGFRFAVKVPKEATHVRRLADPGDVLDRFVPEATALGEKLGPLLVQLPPSLAFDAGTADPFFAALRDRFDGAVVLEPRHATWFESGAERLATKFRVARVAADPAVAAGASAPGGWDGLVYYRLHGSPRVYYSAYDDEYLKDLATKLSGAAESAEVWCVFDNTAEGAATVNALDLLGRVGVG
ncbi:DUF72 domain-containing protein [Gemmata sp.]|uniref:DUF72 domain-containing protein n=1 Tax=Gemmata sp. TaxID=1914242 RepID=UPI003F7209A9